MSCIELGSGVVVCSPRCFNWRTITFCPTCGHRRWFLASCAIWYDATLTCLTCGERWADGERLPRPFARGWRKESVRRAKNAPFKLKAEAWADLEAELAEMTVGATS